MVIAMPTYAYRCGQGCRDFTELHPMATVPDVVCCPNCDGQARRKVGAPSLGIGSTTAMRLHDGTRATADSPDVVRSLPASGRRAQVTANPLHRKLPRP